MNESDRQFSIGYEQAIFEAVTKILDLLDYHDLLAIKTELSDYFDH